MLFLVIALERALARGFCIYPYHIDLQNIFPKKAPFPSTESA